MPGEEVYLIPLGWYFSKFGELREIQLVPLDFNMGDGVPGPWVDIPLVLPQNESVGGTAICQRVF